AKRPGRGLLPLEERFRRGREFVEGAPLPRSGHGGHNTTFAVTRALLNDYALPDDEARDLLDLYNGRLEEPWTEREPDHKAESAGGDSDDCPHGCRAGSPERANDPDRLAHTFTEGRPWVFWNGRHFEYDGRRYVEVPDCE